MNIMKNINDFLYSIYSHKIHNVFSTRTLYNMYVNYVCCNEYVASFGYFKQYILEHKKLLTNYLKN